MAFAIIDLQGFELTSSDCDILEHPSVAGVILFTRNYGDRQQLRALCKSIHQLRPDCLIMVDQEGGRVQRFRKDFTPLPSMREWGVMYVDDPHEAKKQLSTTIAKMASELQAVGVNMSVIPDCDIDHGMSSIIGDRSFSEDPVIVTALAQVIVDVLSSVGMQSVAKHFPGHGGVSCDSHHDLPIDHRTKQQLMACDILPFAQLSSSVNMIMPAHITYPACDDKPASFSTYWLQTVLRQELGFTGKIICDDISMQAAASMGDYPTRAALALEAGCDLLPICNNRQGVEAILDQAAFFSRSLLS